MQTIPKYCCQLLLIGSIAYWNLFTTEFFCEYLRMFEIAKTRLQKFQWLYSIYSHDEFPQNFFNHRTFSIKVSWYFGKYFEAQNNSSLQYSAAQTQSNRTGSGHIPIRWGRNLHHSDSDPDSQLCHHTQNLSDSKSAELVLLLDCFVSDALCLHLKKHFLMMSSLILLSSA